MNENLNLVEILKDCPKGTKLYSPIYGDVELVCVLQNESEEYPIQTKMSDDELDGFTKDGRMFDKYKGECMLFPSREERNWSKFKPKQPKFNPKTLNTFDKVLVRLTKDGDWHATFFSYYDKEVKRGWYQFITISGTSYSRCIPYNEDTKHLLGTNKEAPEFYRYWED